ncbi:alpha-D-ribose 1-methylphosphonate 5-triphosphate diphosphatase [Ancylobacter amanitiformis]|uniref:Alpha-D-ribose 1-methylphosphonate 5-triphosphate diphosphatase n=1 Tax=Ancylobacter amanitiformis TaxID=217069 RepID=A0ABU0LQX6_9HYPH|nr:alpha-D-ribose 1-methylphosphonate 5-triphosphate diphosphatase [Ancylobacter amanitiformis]MDQ0511100.1 alpha-D-ribose 1-methylphosphonate 5-triphosphate diphosphatase [Ancylobacter amanitiformis]
METILTNVRLVLEDRVVEGTLVHENGTIRALDEGRSQLPGAVDCDGDYLAPGLIDLHTDALEGHFVPRPKVIWPDARAAALAHDAQMAGSGVTTVYDAICAGGFDQAKADRRALYEVMLDAVEQGATRGMFRVDHRIHLRCELTDHGLPDLVDAALGRPNLSLASLMDHTPGTRQWRNVEHLKVYLSGIGKGGPDIDAEVADRIERAKGAVAGNYDKMVALFSASGIVLASHDDTTPAHVDEALAAGCSISEFPTTLEAARAAKASGLATIGGAPNVVRGGSHSGGVSMRDLAQQGLLDALASDYVPASLLQAALALTRTAGLALPAALALVTAAPARLARLDDRGRLAPGLRADLLRFRLIDDTPAVGEVMLAGRRVF